MRSTVFSLLLALLLSGCAHARTPLKPWAARTLMVAGALTTTGGVLTTVGCADISDQGGCSAGPGGGDVALGLPLLAAGITMFTIGVLRRPEGVRISNYGPPPSKNPDPFVPPLNEGTPTY